LAGISGALSPDATCGRHLERVLQRLRPLALSQTLHIRRPLPPRPRRMRKRRLAWGRKLCGAKTRMGRPCVRKALANGKCPNHGGMSSGPKTMEGRWVLALERATPTRVANTMTVNPIAAGLLATQLVGEPIRANLIVGLIAVFAGIWIATTAPRKA
jgi:hypothetical protein